MATRAPKIYARVSIQENNFRRFGAHIEDATMKGIDAAGRAGAIEARNAMTRVRTGESRRKIGWNRRAGSKIGSIYVGTVQGSIQEYGTEERQGPRGRVTPLKFLWKGLLVSMGIVLAEIRRRT